MKNFGVLCDKLCSWSYVSKFAVIFCGICSDGVHLFPQNRFRGTLLVHTLARIRKPDLADIGGPKNLRNKRNNPKVETGKIQGTNVENHGTWPSPRP